MLREDTALSGMGRPFVIRRLAAILLLFASLAFCGCAASVCRVVPQSPVSTHLIFNPERTGVPPRDMTRADWPATPAYAHGAEQVEYRETIIDRQGRFGADQDRLYRRFESVRTGWSRR
jgi:hypothetical protein